MNSTQIVDERTHPVDRALAKAMEEIHADYERVMALRCDAEGNLEPMRLPDDRPLVK